MICLKTVWSPLLLAVGFSFLKKNLLKMWLEVKFFIGLCLENRWSPQVRIF